jgi:hypothetical protein
MNELRTVPEIVARYRDTRAEDILGFHGSVLLEYLPVTDLRQFCKEGADLSDWTPSALTREAITEAMREYMEFAWGKATGHRGISANRSVAKLAAWLWLLGDGELAAFANDSANYPYYGGPILGRICEKYGFPIPDEEAARRMASGQPCEEHCCEGCHG